MYVSVSVCVSAMRFVYSSILLFVNAEMSNKIVALYIESTVTSYLFEFEFPPKFKLPPRSQGGAGVQLVALVVDGVGEAALGVPARFDDDSKRFKSDRGERVVRPG